MTKRRSPQEEQAPPHRNPVAKFAHHYNKFQIFANKRSYQRKAKHRNSEPFAIFS